MNLWKKKENNEPIIVLAPMADVTDAAFRSLIAKKGKPNIIYTEFVSADGLILATEEGKKKLMKDLIYDESERPIVAQLFTSRPEIMRQAARLVAELGFDGLDINMGCPDRSIEKQGAGAALIKNPENAKAVILAAKEGIKDAGKDIPVSVKTRLGYNKIEIDTWLPELLSAEPAAIIIHARTRKEMSKVPAQWGEIKRAVELRDNLSSRTLILGNGDVKSVEEAQHLARETGADGVMLGRAIFGNPWLFSGRIPENKERIETLIEHIRLFDELLGSPPAGGKNFAIMKKHFKSYLAGIDGIGDVKTALFETKTANEAIAILEEYRKSL